MRVGNNLNNLKLFFRTALLRTFLGPRLKNAEARKFRQQFDSFKKLSDQSQPRFHLSWEDRNPVLGEDKPGHGFDRHYIYHTGWAARKVKENAPEYHVDISSSLYFASIVSAFVPLRFYDYRPARLELPNLTCDHADLVDLPFEEGSIQSLSCMHVVEHIGLGRYGDPLDPEGDMKAMHELERVLAVDGSLLFVVPVGKPVLHFNSHRVYSFDQILAGFPGLRLIEFSLVPDDKKSPLLINANPNLVQEQGYGCGCFLFKKISSIPY
jgi:hypothetical protein